MGTASQALHLALDVARVPALADVVGRQELPDDVLTVIRIAAGCEDTLRWAADLTVERPEHIRRSAELYLQAALFHRHADSFRILGVTRGAGQETIREHFRWLMRWLHPDRNRDSWNSVFAPRVATAWDDLKTPARRARYEQRRAAPRDGPQARPSGSDVPVRMPWITWPLDDAPARGRSKLPLACGVIAMAAGLLVPGPDLPSPWASSTTAGQDVQAEAPARGAREHEPDP